MFPHFLRCGLRSKLKLLEFTYFFLHIFHIRSMASPKLRNWTLLRPTVFLWWRRSSWTCRGPMRMKQSTSYIHCVPNNHYWTNATFMCIWDCAVLYRPLCHLLSPALQVLPGCDVSRSSRTDTSLLHQREPCSLPAQHLPLRETAGCTLWFLFLSQTSFPWWWCPFLLCLLMMIC